MHFRMRCTTEFLSEEALETIFQSAVRILARVPFRIQGTPEFMDYLRDFGCEIDGERVRFPPPVIDGIVDRIRAAKEQNLARDRSRLPGWPGSEVHAFTHGQGMLACDLETNRLRPATTEDLKVWCRVVDAFGDVGRSHPTFLPTDVPNDSVDFNAYATIVLNSREAHRVSVYNAKMLPYFIEASVVAQGSLDAVKERPVFATKMWVNSPFMITRENVEIAMAARRLLGQPIHPSTMPTAGAAAPATIAGALAQNTAEMLGLNGITLAVDGRMAGSSVGPLVADMRTGTPRTYGPDVVLHRAAMDCMRVYLWGSQPSWSATSTAAPVVSLQGQQEKALAMTFAIAGGVRSAGIGCLGTSDVGSLAQLMLDYDMVGYFRHLLRDVQVDPEHVDEQTIVDVTRRGAYYMDTEHTARFFREATWLPRHSDFRFARAWQDDPSDMIESAKAQARDMVQTAENQCPLDADQCREIRRLVEAANREAASSLTR